jgi:hypothetical protein
VGAPLGEQVRDPVGEHARLARSGAGDDQQRATLVHDCRTLLRVEAVEQGRRVDRDPRPRTGFVGLFVSPVGTAREREQGVGVTRHVASQPTCAHRHRPRAR